MRQSLKTPFFSPLVGIWIINCILSIGIAIRQVWIPSMNASSDAYTMTRSDPFDGTVMPIAFIPNWLKGENQDKAKHFTDIPIREFIPIPKYNITELLDDSGKSLDTIVARYTYIGVYMGSYRLNYKESDGSHLAVDIRAPIGTPVLSIANGVVVRAVESDAMGNKFIVVRHDGVKQNGKEISLYSAYEHLSEITIPEGVKIRKGDMIGRVGITGFTTTPHLHFQIDLPEAPFHPYWPFGSKELSQAKLDFSSAVDAGLGSENARKYTIHPLEFVQANLNGGIGVPEKLVRTESKEKVIVAGAIEPVKKTCVKKRFSDIDEQSVFAKSLYTLADAHCLFQDRDTFDGREKITRREALTLIMDGLGIKPMIGSSDFLDVGIGDPLQGYLMRAKQLDAVEGLYFAPDTFISKEEFIDMLVHLEKIEKNPSTMPLFPDVSEESKYFDSIQAYGYMIHAQKGRFYPALQMTRAIAIQILVDTRSL